MSTISNQTTITKSQVNGRSYVLSVQTLNLIHCIEKYDELYNSIYKCIEETYGESQVDFIFQRDFSEKCSAVEEEIEKYLLQSMIEKISSPGEGIELIEV